MRNKKLKVVFIILIILVTISVFVAGTILALPVLKKVNIEVAEENIWNIKKNYATENFSNTDSLETTDEEQEVTRNYEIKSEKIWDISKNQDSSVMAKWTLADRTLRISGNGDMKNWTTDDNGEWHENNYSNVINKIIIENGVNNIGEYAFYGSNKLSSIEILSSIKEIGEGAFYKCKSLRNIEIPDSVVEMGEGVFAECISLTNVRIPSKITEIKDGVFFECNSLTSIEIPSSVTSIGEVAFCGCSSLANVEIPSSVTSIGDSAFYGCSSLESIKIPSSVTSIEISAFLECSSLKEIKVDNNNKNYIDENGILYDKNKTRLECYPTGKMEKSFSIPSSVISIGDGAFVGCSSLESIEIPSSVTSIGESAFYGCSSLKEIKVDNNNKNYIDENGILYDKNKTRLECYPTGKMEKSFSIPSSVISIGDGAFVGCSSLESINIPETVKKIEPNAISERSIIYTKADSEGHRYAEERKQGYILEGEATDVTTKYMIKNEDVWDISENQDGSVMAKWTLADRTIRISGSGEKKWSLDCRKYWNKNQYINLVKNVIVENGITNIKFRAFEGCSRLESIEIPSSVTSIEDLAFFECSSLKAIKVDNNNENYTDENGIVYNKNKTKIICYPGGKTEKNFRIPNSVTSIGYGAFAGCSSLENIEIPSGVTIIENYAFWLCSSLASIEIPSSVTNIKWGTFSECSSLSSIKIPSSVTSIEEYAFRGCSSLKNIEIPSSVTSIGEYAFERCSSLVSINIPETVTNIGNGAIPSSTIIYTKVNSEAHKYAEKNQQGYIICKFGINKYEIKNNYIVKIKPNTIYNEFINEIWTSQTYTIKEGEKEIGGTDLIKTGQVLTTESGNQYTLVVIGDLNGDGKISLVELARISKIGVGKVNDIKEIEKMAIDVNVDGNITILDLASIAKLQNQK